MAIETLDETVNAIANKTQMWEYIKAFTPQAAGCFMSLFHAAGQPGPPAYPSPGVNGVAVDDSAPGGYGYVNPTGGDTAYLSHFDLGPNQAGTLILCDRLWHNSGLSPTTVGAQAISPAALTRYTDGVGVEAWLDVYGTALGSNATAPQISYTDDQGNTGNTATALGFVTAAAINRCFPFGLAAGDKGVRAINSYNNMASKVSGAFGLVLRRRLAQVSTATAGGGAPTLDFISSTGPIIPDDTCFELLWVAAGTSAAIIFPSVAVSQS